MNTKPKLAPRIAAQLTIAFFGLLISGGTVAAIIVGTRAKPPAPAATPAAAAAPTAISTPIPAAVHATPAAVHATPAAAHATPAAPAPAPAPAASAALAPYPVARRIKLAACMGAVSPAFSQRIELPVSAQVVFKFNGRAAAFKKGELWAEVDPERLKLEAARMDFARGEVERKTGLLEARAQELQSKARLREIERTLALMDMPEPADGDVPDGGNDLKVLRENAAKAKAALEEERDLVRKRLAVLLPEAEAREAAKANDYALRKLDFERLKDASLLTAPCDAQVTLLFETRDGKSEYPVKSGVPFAEIVDSRRYFVAIPVSGQGWRGVPAAELAVQIRAVTGVKIEAAFVESRAGKFLGRDEQLYVFEFSDADGRSAGNLAGGVTSCEVVRKIAASRIIPKLGALCAHPAAFRGREWREAVEILWPGSRMVAEGEAEIAVSDAGVSRAEADEAARRASPRAFRRTYHGGGEGK
jgi:hypothetical protein